MNALRQMARRIFCPPYEYLPWLLWFYVAACAFLQPHSSLHTGRLIGFDDQVRMIQVLNWVNGAGWYNHTIMRVDPPEGFTTIWSRIVDIPIAAVIIFMQNFVPQKAAAIMAATIVPLAELALIFIAAPYFVKPLVGKRYANLITLFILFTSIVNLKQFSVSGFAVGEASHHPWYIILDLVLFGAVARMTIGLRRAWVMAGFAAAMLTIVGIEGYPMIAGAVGLLALTSWLYAHPNVALEGGKAIFASALGSAILLPIHQPPASYFSISFAEPSFLGVILLSVAGLFLLIETITLQKITNRKISAGVLVSLAVGIALSLIHFFPQMLDGAAAGLSPAERKTAFENHAEAKPLYLVAKSVVEFIGLIMPILIAWTAAIYACLCSTRRRRKIAICYAGFALIGGGLSCIFSRFYHHAMTTCSAWLLWLWQKIKSRLPHNGFYALTVCAAFISLAPFWMLFLPATAEDRPFGSQVLSFPAATRFIEDPCDSLPVATYINEHYGKNVLLIVPYWLSAQFLYQTDVQIDFLDNYPSHDKFIDHFSFWYARVPELARIIALQHHIDLLAVCTASQVYNPDFPTQLQSFLYRLQIGQAPSWLKPVPLNFRTYYRLYEVDKETISKPGVL